MGNIGSFLLQVHKWVTRICEEKEIEDVSVVKPLLTLLFITTARLTSCAPLALALAQDIHVVLKDIFEVSI